MKILKLILVIVTLETVLARDTTRCSKESIVSLDEDLTPPGFIQASDIADFITPPKENVLIFGYNGDNNIQSWCTDTNDPNPNIIIRFSEPVIITRFISSGSRRSQYLYYTTNFTLEYSNNSDSDFVYYQTKEDRIKYFHQPETIGYYKLDPPVITEAIRLRQLEWIDTQTTTFQYICQGVGLIGCRLTEVANESVTTSEPLNTSELPEVTAQEIFIRDYLVLGILLPIALITILAVTAIVVVGVVICLRNKSSHKYEIPLDPVVPLSPGERRVDNFDLYTAPSETDGNYTVPPDPLTNKYETVDPLDTTEVKSPRPVPYEDPVHNIEIIYADNEKDVQRKDSMVANSLYETSNSY